MLRIKSFFIKVTCTWFNNNYKECPFYIIAYGMPFLWFGMPFLWFDMPFLWYMPFLQKMLLFHILHPALFCVLEWSLHLFLNCIPKPWYFSSKYLNLIWKLRFPIEPANQPTICISKTGFSLEKHFEVTGTVLAP